MGALRKPYPHRSSKKLGSTNPYAERGLDKFALVSAELEAKRERLVAQLGASLSLVRFAIGSNHSGWIPVIVCPTLSKAEIRNLKRTAARLITEDRPAISYTNAHQIHTLGVSNAESKHASSLTCYEKKDVLAHDDLSTHDQPAHISVAHEEDAKTGCQIGLLSYLLRASERFLWMAAFTISVAVDVVSSALLSKCVAPPKGILPSTRRPKEESDSPSATMASSMNFPSLPPIRTHTGMSAKDLTPPHSAAHVESPKTRNRCKSQGFSTAPSTPRDSRQVKKSFHPSVSFPMTTRMRDEAPRSGIRKDSKFLKSVSLPKTSHSQVSNSYASPILMVSKRERKERSENVGQALTGAGLALGLGGLVMGYIPAIICVVCWWYVLPILRKDVGDKPHVLPTLRKAVGDKPHVKSHHL